MPNSGVFNHVITALQGVVGATQQQGNVSTSAHNQMVSQSILRETRFQFAQEYNSARFINDQLNNIWPGSSIWHLKPINFSKPKMSLKLPSWM